MWHTIRKQIEQPRVVGQLLGLLARRRAIAALDTSLRCRDSVGAHDGTGICIRWWSTLGVSVGTRQLHPHATLVDKCTDFAEERMVHSIRLWDVGEMIKDNRRGNP